MLCAQEQFKFIDTFTAKLLSRLVAFNWIFYDIPPTYFNSTNIICSGRDVMPKGNMKIRFLQYRKELWKEDALKVGKCEIKRNFEEIA